MKQTAQELMEELKAISPSLYQEVQEALAFTYTTTCVGCGIILPNPDGVSKGAFDTDTICDKCVATADDAIDWLE